MDAEDGDQAAALWRYGKASRLGLSEATSALAKAYRDGLGVKADGLLMELDIRGIAASSGSACASVTGAPSHVLRAIGCDRAIGGDDVSAPAAR